jgi:hypothetical protein
LDWDPGDCPDCDTNGSWGDPHLVTFDGLKYDFQASGEFILARSLDSSFEVQQPYKNSADIAINTAVTIKLQQDLVSFYNQNAPDGSSPIWINGRPQSLEIGSFLTLNNGILFHPEEKQYTLAGSE